MSIYLAIVPTREGSLAAGGDEVVAEVRELEPTARVVVIGRGAHAAAAELAGLCDSVGLMERDCFEPARWSRDLATLVADAEVIVLPASPDGRDLAPRLAAVTGRALIAGAISIRTGEIVVARQGGLLEEHLQIDGPVIVTLQPHVRGAVPTSDIEPTTTNAAIAPADSAPHDAQLIEVLPPDPATMDLAEAPRLVGGGAGLMSGDAAARFAQLGAIADALGASMGATRVVTDAGWVSHDRQIGTTGVVVDPQVYVAFAISGAVQHTAGLGHPEHIISVNTDPHCPMMAMADLAIVADANATVDALADRLGAAATTAHDETSNQQVMTP